MMNWFSGICSWKSPVTTVLVHILLLILVWYPELLLPTVFLYMFLIGAWNYRFRSRTPPFMDAKLSQGEHIGDLDELEEEFNVVPANRAQEVHLSLSPSLCVLQQKEQPPKYKKNVLSLCAANNKHNPSKKKRGFCECSSDVNLNKFCKFLCFHFLKKKNQSQKTTIHLFSNMLQVLKHRYERLRGVAGRIQNALGELATMGERVHSLLNWRDPR